MELFFFNFYYSIVKNTIENKDKIIFEHSKFVEFQRANPEYTYNLAEKFSLEDKLTSKEDFEKIIEIKNEFLIDNITKIYKQIYKQNPYLNNTPCVVFYYSVKNNLFETQKEAGFEIGQLDNNNNLVTGSNLILERFVVNNVIQFSEIYFALAN